MSIILIMGGGAIAAGIMETIQDLHRKHQAYKRRARIYNMWRR